MSDGVLGVFRVCVFLIAGLRRKFRFFWIIMYFLIVVVSIVFFVDIYFYSYFYRGIGWFRGVEIKFGCV